VGRTHAFGLAAVLLAFTGGVAAAKPAPRFGVMVDAGVPDGANAALTFRPMGWLRAHAGGGYNLISPGVRGGISLLPLSFLSFNVDVGHYFVGDANKMMQMFGESDSDVAVLREVSYDYANFHLGLELGGKRAAFYIHGGMSHIWGTVRQAEEMAAESGFSGADLTFSEDPKLRIWTVSARMGVVVYLF
jgi:hypothetical protein